MYNYHVQYSVLGEDSQTFLPFHKILRVKILHLITLSLIIEVFRTAPLKLVATKEVGVCDFETLRSAWEAGEGTKARGFRLVAKQDTFYSFHIFKVLPNVSWLWQRMVCP
jgi:hypothetical protein